MGCTQKMVGVHRMPSHSLSKKLRYSLSLSHTHFQCLVNKMSNSVSLETSRNTGGAGAGLGFPLLWWTPG